MADFLSINISSEIIDFLAIHFNTHRLSVSDLVTHRDGEEFVVLIERKSTWDPVSFYLYVFMDCRMTNLDSNLTDEFLLWD